MYHFSALYKKDHSYSEYDHSWYAPKHTVFSAKLSKAVKSLAFCQQYYGLLLFQYSGTR